MVSAACAQPARSPAVTASRLAASRVPPGDVGGGPQVLLRHHVRVHVVVAERRVLVGAGHAGEAEAAVAVVMTERAPQPGRLHQQLEAFVAFEGRVVGGVDVADHGVGDVGVDVDGGGAGRPVAGALLAGDRPPGEGGSGMAEGGGPGFGGGEDGVTPEEGVPRRLRPAGGEDRQDVRLGVPEGVPVVTGAGEPLGRDRPLLRPGAGLEHVEQAEAGGLLDRRVAVEFDGGPGPERVEVTALLGLQAVPAGVVGSGESRGHLVRQRLPGPDARPAVGQQLHDPEALTRLEHGRHAHPGDVDPALATGVGAVGPVDQVVHGRRHPQAAVLGAVHQGGGGRASRAVVLVDQR